MATRTKLSRWTTLFVSCTIVVVGLMMTVGTGSFRLPQRRAISQIDVPFPGATQGGHFPSPQPITITATPDGDPAIANPPDNALAERWSRYDNVIVDVDADGTLRVLGERMGMADFRSLLVEQMTIQLKTMVTIRPDADCLFRDVGPVIAICREAGVPHLMQSASTAEPAAVPPPGGPA